MSTFTAEQRSALHEAYEILRAAGRRAAAQAGQSEAAAGQATATRAAEVIRSGDHTAINSRA